MRTMKNVVVVVNISRFEKKKLGLISRKKRRREEVEKEVTFATGTAIDGC